MGKKLKIYKVHRGDYKPFYTIYTYSLWAYLLASAKTPFDSFQFVFFRRKKAEEIADRLNKQLQELYHEE